MAAKGATGTTVARQVLRDGVHEAVLEMLLDGGIAPGAPLSIDGLARDLGVSPTPVREALVHLEHTGLVTRAALKGYRVATPLSAEQMAELMDARTVVELAAIERAMTQDRAWLPELYRAHAAHLDAVHAVAATAENPGPPTAAHMRHYFEADWAFHVVIMRASGNRYLLQMLDGMGTHLHRLRQAVGQGGVSDAEAAIHEHTQVLRTLEAGNAAGAVAAMREHLENVRSRATGLPAGDGRD